MLWFFSSTVKLLVLCIDVIKSVKGAQRLSGFDMASGEHLFIIQIKTTIYGLVCCRW